MPSIHSKQCKGSGSINGKDGPKCDTCWNLRKEKGSKYTTDYVKIWGINIWMAIERSKNSELMATDKEAIMDLLKTKYRYLTTDGMELMVEAEAQIKYITQMEGIHFNLTNNE